MDPTDHPADRLSRNLDWNLLRTYVAIVEHRGLTAAARALGLQQPTLSNALRRLEETLGRKLIDRGPAVLKSPPPASCSTRGGRYPGGHPAPAPPMRDVTEEVSGHVRIVMASHVVCPLFDQALADFRETLPRASLTLDVSGCNVAVEEVVALAPPSPSVW